MHLLDVYRLFTMGKELQTESRRWWYGCICFCRSCHKLKRRRKHALTSRLSTRNGIPWWWRIITRDDSDWHWFSYGYLGRENLFGAEIDGRRARDRWQGQTIYCYGDFSLSNRHLIEDLVLWGISPRTLEKRQHRKKISSLPTHVQHHQSTLKWN